MIKMQKITPFLWFDDRAEEAARFYTSLFKNSSIDDISHYGEVGPGENGSVMSLTFRLDGQEFIALNGGPHFTFSPAISFFIRCATQAEIDELWEKLSEGGEKQQCGWLKDKFGVTWQVVPAELDELLHVDDAAQSKRVMSALLDMEKLDIDRLREAAHAGTAKP